MPRLLLVLFTVAVLLAATLSPGGSDQMLDIAPQLQMPQFEGEGDHPQAWAEDVTIGGYRGKLSAVEIKIEQYAHLHYAYDPIDTSNIPGGEHWVGWLDGWNRIRLRVHGMLVCENLRRFDSIREWAPKGWGDFDVGNPPVVGDLELTDLKTAGSVYLTDPAILSLFEDQGEVPVRIVSWSDYSLYSPADVYMAHGAVLSGLRLEVIYHGMK